MTLTPGEELFIRQQPVKMVIADEQVSRPPQVIVKIRRETLVNIAVNIKKQGLDSCGASVSYFCWFSAGNVSIDLRRSMVSTFSKKKEHSGWFG